MMISIIVPLYNEEESIKPLYNRLKKTMNKLRRKYEIIFIDDGSTDKSFNVLKKIAKKDKKFRVVKFSRNFGQSAALSAGFKSTKGDIIVSLDADLQNDPKDIPRLLKKMKEGYDVVCGWRGIRKDPFTKKTFSRLANWLENKITNIHIHDLGCTLRAYKRNTVKDIYLYGELHRYVPLLLFWKGYSVAEIEVKHHERKYGKTKYGIHRLYHGFLDLLGLKFLEEYKTRPLHIFGTIGLFFMFIGFILACYLTVMKFVYSMAIADRPLLLLSILLMFLGGQFISTGLLGGFVSKIYFEVEKREPYMIEKKINL